MHAPHVIEDPRLAQILASPDDNFPLGEAALLLGREEYPELDVAQYLRQLDTMAALLRARMRADISAADSILALNRYLFEELGFAGNAVNYYDPRNSFLNEVLERKLGIPITLSILYMEVGSRIGLALKAVAFPGHFLVTCPVREGAVIIDPYNKGITLSLADLQQRLAQVRGGATPGKAAVAAALVTAGPREILARMLRNLKAIYLRYEQANQALTVCDRILMLCPDEPEEWRDRGAIYLGLECFRAALGDFQQYLQLAPGAHDAQIVRERVVELQRQAARLN